MQLTDDDEALKDEEEEAQRLQREAAEQLQPEDFEQQEEAEAEEATSSSDDEPETMGSKARQVQALLCNLKPHSDHAHFELHANTCISICKLHVKSKKMLLHLTHILECW